MGKNITRQQIESLIDRLADETLSFGCKCYDNNPEALYKGMCTINSVYVDNSDKEISVEFIIDSLEHEGREIQEVSMDYFVNNFKILGHPILIGDALEKMITTEEEIVFNATTTLPKHDKLLFLWLRCGFSKSLQTIVEESGWKNEEIKPKAIPIGMNHRRGVGIIPKSILKSPKANKLLSYLYNLFIK